MTLTRPAWTKTSWRNYEAKHQPVYADQAALELVLRKLSTLPPLVTAEEIGRLKHRLAAAQRGETFVLQAGDCAETFDECTPEKISGQVRIMTQMQRLIATASGLPVIRIGRIAGQYAKPRTSMTELHGDRMVPAFLGDSINGYDAGLRTPDPERLLWANFHATATMNHLRTLPADAMRDFFTSHEALMLAAEEQATRRAEDGSHWFNLSAHMLWIGERTRSLTGAHVEYARGIANPVGVKVGPGADVRELLAVLSVLNPRNEPGKTVLITRLGRQVRSVLPGLISAVRAAELKVVWLSDPMHGNTTVLPGGIKTRAVEDVLAELTDSARIHRESGGSLHGAHLELTGEPVTECTGGTLSLTSAQLSENYKTRCDPRLNDSQSLDVARCLADLTRRSDRVPAPERPATARLMSP